MDNSASKPALIREQYERDGYAIFRDVLDSDLIKEVSDHVDWLLEKNPELRPEHLHHRLVREDPFWVRLISDPRLLNIAEIFIGPNIALFASHYISKPPTDGRPVLWHQDGSYWPLAPMEVTTLWLAVDDSTPTNGCMRVIPGTHRMELHEMQRSNDAPNVLSSHIDPALVDESQAIDFVLKAGDCLSASPKHHSRIQLEYVYNAALRLNHSLHPNEHTNHLRGTLALCVSVAG